MSDDSNKSVEALIQAAQSAMDQVENPEEVKNVETTVASEVPQSEQPVPTVSEEQIATKKKKLTKKQWMILGGAAAALIVLLIILLTPSKFKRVENECVHIAGQLSSGKNYFTIDTYPDSYKNMDATLRNLLLPSAQENALKAIQYANKELGFPDSVYTQMMNTNALMGRQYAETKKYSVSWTYHPNTGLEVTYTKK